MRVSVERGRPYGEEKWVREAVNDLRLEQTVCPEGRPRKASQTATGATNLLRGLHPAVRVIEKLIALRFLSPLPRGGRVDPVLVVAPREERKPSPRRLTPAGRQGAMSGVFTGVATWRGPDAGTGVGINCGHADGGATPASLTETPMLNAGHNHHLDTSESEADVAQPAARREIIYYLQTKRPLIEVAALPYTDVIVAFLVPSDTASFTLGLSEKDDPGMLTAGIGALHAAGKRVLISLGGHSFPAAAYAQYAKDVNALAGQIVGDWVAKYQFDGVDIDFEDSEAFYDPTAAGYCGRTFLIELTRGLASQLPPTQRIITHCAAVTLLGSELAQCRRALPGDLEHPR